jgi:hypothetical protein
MILVCEQAPVCKAAKRMQLPKIARRGLRTKSAKEAPKATISITVDCR